MFTENVTPQLPPAAIDPTVQVMVLLVLLYDPPHPLTLLRVVSSSQPSRTSVTRVSGEVAAVPVLVKLSVYVRRVPGKHRSRGAHGLDQVDTWNAEGIGECDHS